MGCTGAGGLSLRAQPNLARIQVAAFGATRYGAMKPCTGQHRTMSHHVLFCAKCARARGVAFSVVECFCSFFHVTKH